MLSSSFISFTDLHTNRENEISLGQLIREHSGIEIVTFNIVSMAANLAVLGHCPIEINGGVYHRAGKGWTDDVSSL